MWYIHFREPLLLNLKSMNILIAAFGPFCSRTWRYLLITMKDARYLISGVCFYYSVLHHFQEYIKKNEARLWALIQLSCRLEIKNAIICALPVYDLSVWPTVTGQVSLLLESTVCCPLELWSDYPIKCVKLWRVVCRWSAHSVSY